MYDIDPFADLIPAGGANNQPGGPPNAPQVGPAPGRFVQQPAKLTEQWRDASPEEVKASGRDPSQSWQVNGAGEWKAAGKDTAAPEIKARENVIRLMHGAGVDLEKGVDPISDLIRGSTSGVVEHAGAEAYELGTGILGGIGIGEGGRATPGMENIAKLETIANAMTLEMTGGNLGNQISDADREFFLKQFGDMGNPNLAANRRLAAWEQVKQRFSRIGGIPYNAPKPTQEQAPPGAATTEVPPPPGQEGGVPPAPGQAPPNPEDIQFGPDERTAALKQAQDHRDEYEARIARGDSIEQLNAWRVQIGAQPMSKDDAKTISDARAAGSGVGVQQVTPEMILSPEEKARVDKAAGGPAGEGTEGAAFGAGASQSIPFLNKAAAGVTAVGEALAGEGSFGERYDRNRAMQEALFGQLQETHPFAFLGGEVAGAMTMPTGVEGAMVTGGKAAYKLARLGGATEDIARTAATKGARFAGMRQMAGEGAAYGGALGASESEGGPGSMVTNALGGAALGGVTGSVTGLAPFVAEPLEKVAKRLGPLARRGVDQTDIEASRAAQDLGITMPEYVVGGEAARRQGASLKTKGEARLTDASTKLLEEGEEAAAQAAAKVGQRLDDVNLGEMATRGGLFASKSGKRRIGSMFDSARKGAAGVDIPATKTEAALRQLADSEAQAIGGSAIGNKFTQLADQLVNEQRGVLTVEGARQTRTNLRDQLVNELGLTKSNATRLTNHVMRALTEDMEAGLKAAGKEDVFKLFQKADREWRELMAVEDRVIEPIIGKEGEKNADEVARILQSDAKGRGMRLAKFLNNIPPDRANHIRATLIDRLGRRTADDDFSYEVFAGNWKKMAAARNLIFDKETVQSLEKLASVAKAVNRAEKASKGSPTAGMLMAGVKSGAPIAAGIAGYESGGWKGGVLGGVVMPMLMKGRSMRTAKLLASPKFAQKLARTPNNPKAAREFWSRAWVNQIAKTNPEIANEVLGFREDVLNALGASDSQQGVEAPQ